MSIRRAPFTPDQVQALERQQQNRTLHPFTCPNRSDGNHRENDIDLGALVPTVRGWICQYCDYTQGWAREFIAGSVPGEQQERA